MKTFLCILTVLLSLQMNAQVSEITEIPNENLLSEFQLDPTLNTNKDDAISLKPVKYENQVVMFFYTAKGFAKTSSLDNGKTWSTAELFHELEDGRAPRIRNAFDVSINSDGSYLIFAQPYEDGFINNLGPLAVWKFSNNDQLVFRTDFSISKKDYFDLCRISDQEYYLSYFDKDYPGNPASVIYHSIDGGKNWDFIKSHANIEALSLEYSAIDQKIKAAYYIEDENSSDIVFSEDALTDDIISTSSEIETSNHSIANTKLIVTDDNKLWLVYNEIIQHTQDYSHSEILYLSSGDNGDTWSEKNNFTEYVGDDILVTAGKDNSYPAIVFISNRSENQKDGFFLGNAGFSIDKAPPLIQRVYEPEEESGSFILRVRAFDNEQISSVEALNKFDSLPLFDDGQHYDSLANDNIYGNITTKSHNYYGDEIGFIDVNHLSLPINNKGVLGDVMPYLNTNFVVLDNSANQTEIQVNQNVKSALGRYFDKAFLFSGGFFLSGYQESEIITNGVASTNIIIDYQPGNIGSDPDDSMNDVYSVRDTDIPFGNSWQDWQNAVEQGAYFYDGDNDGIYNPIDKNNNRQWDTNEDKPDLLYDATYFTIFNDGVPSHLRRWNSQSPRGIEIRQTVFASNRNTNLEEVIFVRYSILYKGLGNPAEPDSLTDVIFSVWNDADIGGSFAAAGDDRVGCDTTLQSGYVYNDGEDEDWGINPPALFRAILQGPLVKSNNPDDLGYNRMGPNLGEEIFPGYKNGKLGSYTEIIYGNSILPEPNYVRNYMQGKLPQSGEYPDPCNFEYGDVRNMDCALVNKKFWFSGDPVSNTGWIGTAVQDQFDITSTEAFTLVKDQPMDIIIAYVVGQGTDALNSITRAREITQYVHEEYQRNFSTIVGVDDKPEEVVNSFSLLQNYPNPFNPTTTIKFTLPNLPSPYQGEGQRVRLIVYDILGRKLKTLVNEPKAPGSYEVQFDASQLASGVYFYRLTAGDFVQTKKMILLR